MGFGSGRWMVQICYIVGTLMKWNFIGTRHSVSLHVCHQKRWKIWERFLIHFLVTNLVRGKCARYAELFLTLTARVLPCWRTFYVPVISVWWGSMFVTFSYCLSLIHSSSNHGGWPTSTSLHGPPSPSLHPPSPSSSSEGLFSKVQIVYYENFRREKQVFVYFPTPFSDIFGVLHKGKDSELCQNS